ncbi:unnamed protein product [Oncorhynchus mykiss]|uniref:Anoctamin n=1 Tax=Oncorhynchus mykiss TaxID=8022 RepID=A0A060YQT1_ONCMY|nr:unnamed protein product [Oncorhynchus mykiss]
MLRKGSELLLATGGAARSGLRDEQSGRTQTTDSYGSLQNGGFIPPRYVTASSDDNDDDEDDPIYIHWGNYFRDGRTKIDFVLVWEVKPRKHRSRWRGQSETSGPEEVGARAEEGSSRSERRKAQLARWRNKFTQNLQNAGILLEKEETASEKKTIHYLNLSAPWDVLVYYAEELILRAPLQAQPNPNFNTSDRILRKLYIPNLMAESLPNRPLDYYTCAFRKSKMEKVPFQTQPGLKVVKSVSVIVCLTVHSKEICNSGGSYLMCPLCKTCKPWNISDICPMAQVGYLFDHPGTVFFSVFMSFWAVTFLEYWKRKMATLAHHWDCMDFQEEEERPRPEFAAMAPSIEYNPVTGVKEPYFPERARLSRMLTGSMVIIIMLCVVMIFLVSVIMYRGIVSVMMYRTGSFVLRTQAGNIANISSSMVNLALILLMGQVYTALALQLTKWEMHRTQTQYEDAFTFKVFVFQFVNFYSSPFYVAFFKGRFVGYPGHYGTLLGMRNEECGPGGCLIELAEQLFIIMVGKQLISNVQEFVIPKVKAWQQKRALNKVRGTQNSQEPRRWEEDYQLVECEGLFEEYLEIVLQFGFITIFVAAFPLAPLFALLNNWAEVRLDAHKFVCEYRRPVAERAQNIGVWFNILEALSHLSVIVNAFLIAFTSDSYHDCSTSTSLTTI